MRRAIKNHSGDFGAILALLVLSIVVAGYLLMHERLRFPFIESSPYTLNAEFSTAQAVTPGQGQSVRISGVQIGDIGGVTLKNGVAVVKMEIDPKYRRVIHTDATALLRPRTGLKDMFVELYPGSKAAPEAQPGYTIPVSNTNPDVNVDEVLSSLDVDTRTYLQLLVNGAGNGLKGQGGTELAHVLERFEPTHRDLARLNGAIAVRGRDLQGLVHALARLNQALAAKQTQIISLVDASNRVFHAFASQDQNVSRAVAELPATLRQTTSTLAEVRTFADQLGPTASKLLPAAGALPSANAALAALARPSTPIIRDQIRPFVVAARPLVRNLKPAAVNLATATPHLGTVFTVLNHFVNLLGYNPGSAIHGYLWWLAWADHNARSLFENQDGNGDYRNLFLQGNCATLAQIANGLNGALTETVLNLTPILTNLGACPKQAAADAAAYRSFVSGANLPALSSHAALPGGSGSGAGGKLFLPTLPTK